MPADRVCVDTCQILDCVLGIECAYSPVEHQFKRLGRVALVDVPLLPIRAETVAHAAIYGRVIRSEAGDERSEEHTSELHSLMRISYAVFCLKKKNTKKDKHNYSSTRSKN